LMMVLRLPKLQTVLTSVWVPMAPYVVQVLVPDVLEVELSV
jgi:hypothetical protein